MILALDIGATNIRIALIEKTRIINKIKTPTPLLKKIIINKIIHLISQYKEYSSICISIAGFEQNNKIKGALNMDFGNVPLRSMLKKKFHKPVYIQNDARCAALAELQFGAGKSFKNLTLLTLGTGIGGAIVINKKLYLGNGTAGEVGSMQINNNLFESVASGSASIHIANKIGLKNISSLELEAQAKKGNKHALQVYNTIGENLGIGLANLSYTLAPEAFIIGGGFSRVKFIYSQTLKTFHSLYKINPKPKIIKAKFGDDAGLIGASLLPKSF